MIFVWRKSIHALSASHSTILEEEEEEEEYSPITQEYKTKTKAHSNTHKIQQRHSWPSDSLQFYDTRHFIFCSGLGRMKLNEPRRQKFDRRVFVAVGEACKAIF